MAKFRSTSASSQRFLPLKAEPFTLARSHYCAAYPRVVETALAATIAYRRMHHD